MSDLGFGSATELAAAIRDREVSSRELLEHYLARVERHNPRLNAIVTLDVERARARAYLADAELARGELWGPLHGVPITIKDTIETAGLRTTAGFPPLADHVPATSAPSAARLIDAGAVVFGKTNTPLLAADWQSFNPVFGTTNNPWNPERTPGGSSGGAAAAIAAGLSALELGSDIGGSIRIPSHWTGVFGHKPTHGLVPERGHIPGMPGTLSEVDLAVLGPLARSAADLDLALGLLAGPLADRAIAWRLELPEPRHETLRDFRVAAWLDDAEFAVDAEVRRSLDDAVRALRAAGVRVDDAARPAFALADALDVYLRLFWPIMTSDSPPEVFEGLLQRAAAADPASRDADALMARYATLRHREWLGANEAREHLRAKLAAFFADYDVLLMPVNQVPAIRHDAREPLSARRITVDGAARPYTDLFAWICIATVTLSPATVAPIGRTRENLPVGLQIVGPYLEDRTSIAFAHALAEITGGFEPPPGF